MTDIDRIDSLLSRIQESDYPNIDTLMGIDRDIYLMVNPGFYLMDQEINDTIGQKMNFQTVHDAMGRWMEVPRYTSSMDDCFSLQQKVFPGLTFEVMAPYSGQWGFLIINNSVISNPVAGPPGYHANIYMAWIKAILNAMIEQRKQVSCCEGD